MLATRHDPDPTWEGHLTTWRKTLCDELLTPIEHPTPKDRAHRQNLTLSIRCVDFGPDVFTNTDYDLMTSRLGALMREAGFEVQGAALHYHGWLPWFGGLKDLERLAREAAKRRAQAEADLADALLDDAVREQQEAEMQALRKAFSSMRVKQHLPNMPGLWPVDSSGELIDEATLSPAQRRALAWGRGGFGKAPAPLEEPASLGETVTR
jgi:hypothetical protein